MSLNESNLVETRQHPLGGVQHIFAFDNGYGASVVRNAMSYGGPEGLFELGVLRDGRLDYSTPITNDVLGWLTQDDVLRVLEEIAALPPTTEPPKALNAEEET